MVIFYTAQTDTPGAECESPQVKERHLFIQVLTHNRLYCPHDASLAVAFKIKAPQAPYPAIRRASEDERF
jgi:hypothetical protein